MTNYDVVVIGGGAAGYVAAIRCAQLGKKTAIVDKWQNDAGEPSMGGTCVNAGCVPSKALLDASQNYQFLKKQAQAQGIVAEGISLDLAKLHEHKDKVVQEAVDNIQSLLEGNGVACFNGHGRLEPGNKVSVKSEESEALDVIEGEHIIIASGSKPLELTVAQLDDEHILDSSDALNFDTVPKKLGVIGAGVIGLEVASIWARLGAEVTILEAQPSFLPFSDSDVADEALDIFINQGLDIKLGCRVIETSVVDGKVSLDYKDIDNESHSLQFDKLVVAVGREPYTKNIAAPELNLAINEFGYVHVDEQCKTSLPNVYAIGDVVGGPMLAHKGTQEGKMVAAVIAGANADVNYSSIPSVIYTDPEIAWVGPTEKELAQQETPIKVGRFNFTDCTRAKTMGQAEGFVKVIAHAETDRLLAVHIVGPNAGDIINQATFALEFDASAEDVALAIFAHPTLSEALSEAAMDVQNLAIHNLPKSAKS
ncbi:MAG: dihydrolipoyl dehydrogenase [Kangiellaceae bacterium]|nr:dihydrolipoyl dehydrogenase [Kangiellaceae bacterium]|tara:strand:- start:3232 stop:4674 length:1443 start_codon:yes stop_codon:yes gene_type:complete